jgi:benzoyl-CoA reductase subunit B
MANYPTEPLKCWKKAKELREQYYINYAKAKEKGGLRWSGSAWALDAIPAGLGNDVYSLTGEPYGAAIAVDKKFNKECQDAAESRLRPRPVRLHAHLLGLDHPEQVSVRRRVPQARLQLPDRRSAARTPSGTRRLEAGTRYADLLHRRLGRPLQGPDLRAPGLRHQPGPGRHRMAGEDHRPQVQRRAVHRGGEERDALHLAVGEAICCENKAKPAPLDEKTMYSLYVLATLSKSSKWCADFYQECLDEVKDRVKRGIAAVPNERCRVMSDTQPPWGFLKVFRYLEEYGAVSIGSLYTFGLEGIWETKPDGSWGRAPCRGRRASR